MGLERRKFGAAICTTAMLAIVVGLSAVPRAAFAQEAPPLAAQQMRYTMRDNSVIIGTPVAEDESTVTIQTSIGTIRVYKANILAAQAANGATAAPAPVAPQQPPVYATQPAPPVYATQPAPVYAQPQAPPGYGYAYAVPVRRRPPGRGLVVTGGVLFGVFWGVTAVFALSASATTTGYGVYADPNAWVGVIPVLGPILWTQADGAGELMGLAVLDAVVQGAGLVMIVLGATMRSGSEAAENQRAPRLAVAPMFARNGTGLVLAGRF